MWKTLLVVFVNDTHLWIMPGFLDDMPICNK